MAKHQGIQHSGKKKSTKINFLGLETARWGGGLPREGVVAENLVPSLESLSSLGFEAKGGIWDVPGFLPGCPGPLAAFKKVVQKKLCAQSFVPYMWQHVEQLVLKTAGNSGASVSIGVSKECL